MDVLLSLHLNLCIDAIIPDVTGLVVPPRSPALLADAIALLIQDRSLLLSMSTQSRRFAEDTFDVSHIVSSHISIYNDLYNKSISAYYP